MVGVLTRPDAAAGRGRNLQRSAIGQFADDRGLPVHTPRSARTPEFAELLTELDPDVAIAVAYGNLLPAPVLSIPAHGWINLHFSLLPAWRGAAPVQAAIRAGDPITGATTFKLDPGMDTGPVYGTVTEPIHADDTTGTLLERLSVTGAGLLIATLDLIAREEASLVPQPPDGVSLAPKVTVADARIDWKTPALAIDRLVRSVTPEPGAWTDSPWGRLALGPVEPTDEAGLAPGRLSVGKREVLVGTGSTAVRLGSVQASGRKALAAADWARGVRDASDGVLGTSEAAS